ncbi:hypothetical protein OBBRIDRAFT_80951 [Obba rivulosa]|uniref:Uncharacterized protein n=1 Tax=Obba rivulosa TaxID=1052685 RepID=A0A8E2DJ17_9APHY|nr:hypothetical protein OBBRIDRAFT_80951 [Obba rivulosa]
MAAHELILVQFVRATCVGEYQPGVNVTPRQSTSDSIAGKPPTIYYHSRVTDGITDSSLLFPWGYWSLLPEPSQGPWPELILPNVRLGWTFENRGIMLARFVADVLTHLWNQKKSLWIDGSDLKSLDLVHSSRYDPVRRSSTTSSFLFPIPPP